MNKSGLLSKINSLGILAINYVKENKTAVILKGLSLVVLGLLIMGIKKPHDPIVLDMYTTLSGSMEKMLLLIVLAFTLIRNILFSQRDNLGFLFNIRPIIRFVFIYVVVLWLLGNVGDVWIQAIKNHSVEEVYEAHFIGIVAVLIVGLAFGSDAKIARHQTAKYAGAARAEFSNRGVATETDLLITSVHEAGHALMLAALVEIPFDITVERHRVSVNGVLGTVSFNSANLLKSQGYMEWCMCQDLAGQCAEQVVLGQQTMGATSDISGWNSTAVIYLQNGFGKSYIEQPRNENEVSYNRTILTELMGAQRVVVQDFLEKNKDVLEQMAELIRNNAKLTKMDLQPILGCVELTAQIPRPQELHFGENCRRKNLVMEVPQ